MLKYSTIGLCFFLHLISDCCSFIPTHRDNSVPDVNSRVMPCMMLVDLQVNELRMVYSLLFGPTIMWSVLIWEHRRHLNPLQGLVSL